MTPSEIGAAVGAAGAAIVGAFALRQKLSGDSVERAKDKVQRSELEGAIGELQRLRAKEAVDVEKIARLEAEVKYLKRDMRRLIDLLQKRAPFLPKEVREAVETDFADFDSGHPQK